MTTTMTQLNFNNIATKITNEKILHNYATMHYDFLKLQSNNIHAEAMKRIELEFDEKSKVRAHNIKMKELEIQELQLKLRTKKNKK